MIADETIRDALPVGTEVGGYVIRRVLGQGGFGITYAAASATGMVERSVAIKEFFPQGLAYRSDKMVSLSSRLDRVAYDAALKRFDIEARKLVDVYDHPNILRGENVIHAFDSVFLIMEFIDGMMLHDWVMARGGLAEAELRTVMEPVFDAVNYLHARQSIHRDLSPRNIMIRTMRRGKSVVEPVIIDFGAIGDGLDLIHDSTIAVANPTYSPPEQQEPQGAHQGRFTDVFALGGCLYFAATTRAPIKPMQRLAAVAHGRPDPLPPVASLLGEPNRFGPAFFDGIDQALTLNPKHRPQTVEALRDCLGWGDAPVDPRAAITIIAAAASDQLDPLPTVGIVATEPDGESSQARNDDAKRDEPLTAEANLEPPSEIGAPVHAAIALDEDARHTRVDTMAFTAVATAIAVPEAAEIVIENKTGNTVAEVDQPNPLFRRNRMRRGYIVSAVVCMLLLTFLVLAGKKTSESPASINVAGPAQLEKRSDKLLVLSGVTPFDRSIGQATPTPSLKPPTNLISPYEGSSPTLTKTHPLADAFSTFSSAQLLQPAPDVPPQPAAKSEQYPGAQKATLLEEASNGTSPPVQSTGKVIWQLVKTPSGQSRQHDIARLVGNVEIPGRGIVLTITVEQNTDPHLQASHLIKLEFKLPTNFDYKSIVRVMGFILKSNVNERGDPLSGATAKITNNNFWFALYATDSDKARNIQLLKDRTLLDIVFIYENNRRALLTIEKDAAGERALHDALAAWGN